MIFQSVELKNFLSYASASVDLTTPGPVLVVGKNRGSSSADSNGTGKSAIFEGIVWCLFGETLRGVPSRDVVRRGSSGGCCVRVTWIEGIGGKKYVVERWQGAKSNALNISLNSDQLSYKDKRSTQQAVVQLLGMDFRLFCQSVILGQDSLTFANATDSEKKSILERVAGVEEFETYLQRVKERLVLLRTRKQTLESALEKHRFTSTEALSTRSTFERSLQLDRKGRLAQICRLEEERIGLLQRETEESLSLNELKVIKDTLSTSASVESSETRLQELDGLRTALLNERGSIRGTIQSLKDTQLEIDCKFKRVLDECPTCKRPFDRESRAEERKTLRNDREQVGVRLEEPLRRQEELEQEIQTVQSDQRKVQESLVAVRELEKKKIELEATLVNAASKLEFQVSSLSTQIKELVDLERSSSSAAKRTIAQCELRRLESLTEFEDAEEKFTTLLDEEQYLIFWERGFGKKGVRSYALDNAANFLTRRAARYSQYLTDGEIEVVFSTQRKLASGEHTEDFQVQGFNRSGADVYKGNSVGERQRVDMVVALSLQDFIRSRTSVDINLFVCDEAAANLDTEGAERMARLLVAIAKTGRHCWYITHDQSVKDLFPTRLCVTKHGKISEIEDEQSQSTAQVFAV